MREDLSNLPMDVQRKSIYIFKEYYEHFIPMLAHVYNFCFWGFINGIEFERVDVCNNIIFPQKNES